MEFPTYPASLDDRATSTFHDSDYVTSADFLRKSNYASFRTISCPEADEQSAFYFGLQSPRETKDEFSSFLYLDLAESSSSLHRKPSTTQGRSFLTVTLPDVEDFARTPSPDVTDVLSATLLFADTDASPMPSPTTPSRRRSRDRLPSPKPAPSSLLPPVPSRRHLRPLNLPSTRPPAPPAPASPSVSSHSHSHSAPSILSPSSASFLLSPRTSFLPSFPTPRRSRTQDSASASTTKRESIASSSLTRGASVTSHQRRANRSNALACLEGRACNPHRISRTKTNFMSLSDDEDDAEADDEIADFVQEKAPSQRDSIHLHEAMLLEDEDVVIPASPRCSGRLRSHSRAQAPKIRSRANTLLLNITVPDAPSLPSKTPRSRSGTLESWFPPFADFIDFADDEVTKWRSFVEVGSP